MSYHLYGSFFVAVLEIKDPFTSKTITIVYISVHTT